MSEERPVRVGIIGVGWGSIVQAPAFRAVPGFEVVALCSQRPESVRAAGERLGISDVSTDWRSFVARDDLDLISVCTPVRLHLEQALAAIGAGKHVLVEKPVALSAADAEQMLEAAEAAGVVHAVCFEGRYERDRYAVWQLVAEGFLGQPYFARAVAMADYWHPVRGLQSEWMYRLDEGGGYLMGMSSHDIDFLSLLLGDPEAVCADVRVNVPRRQRPDGTNLDVDADDTAVVLMRMSSGALATITTSVVGLFMDRRELEFSGSQGTIRVEGSILGGEPVLRAGRVGDEGLQERPLSDRMLRSGAELPKRRAASAIRALALMLEDWLPAFSGKEARGVPTLRDGVRVQRVIDAARRSAAGGGWIELSTG
jgi:predicted dehydrogenase